MPGIRAFSKRIQPTALPQLAEGTKQAIEGYSVDAISTLPEDLICAICYHPAFGGVSTTCEHIFHEKCLLESVRRRKECPSCKAKFGKTSDKYFNPLGRVLSNMLTACVVQCPQGCDSKISWEQLGSHVTHDCPNTPFGCPHVGCEVHVMSRFEIQKHIEECDYAMVICSCNRRMKRKELKDHKATTCLKELVTCSYCSRGGIERGAMGAHLSKECNAATTMSLLKPMQDLIKQLTEEVQDLKQQVHSLPKWKYEFHFNFPMTIQNLPQGGYHKLFGDGLRFCLYPNGYWTKGYTSVFVTSSKFYDASVSIEIGACKRTENFMLGPRKLGGLGDGVFCGWKEFAPLSALAVDQTMCITIESNGNNTAVVNFEAVDFEA